MILGYDPLNFFIRSMLGLKSDNFPLYIATYVGDAMNRDLDGKILIHIELGGDKKKVLYQKEITILREHANYVEDYDRGDCTCVFVFNVPEIWLADFNKVTNYSEGNWEFVHEAISTLSQDYKNLVYDLHPNDSYILKELFKDK